MYLETMRLQITHNVPYKRAFIISYTCTFLSTTNILESTKGGMHKGKVLPPRHPSSELPGVSPDIRRPSSERPGAAPDIRQPASELPGASPDIPRPSSELPGTILDVPDPTSPRPGAMPDVREASCAGGGGVRRARRAGREDQGARRCPRIRHGAPTARRAACAGSTARLTTADGGPSALPAPVAAARAAGPVPNPQPHASHSLRVASAPLRSGERRRVKISTARRA